MQGARWVRQRATLTESLDPEATSNGKTQDAEVSLPFGVLGITARQLCGEALNTATSVPDPPWLTKISVAMQGPAFVGVCVQ